MVRQGNSTKRGHGFAAKVVGVLCLSLVLAVGLGFGVASAHGGASLDVDTFGLEEQSSSQQASVSDLAQAGDLAGGTSDAAASSTLWSKASSRDISQGIADIEAEEEAARLAAEAVKIEAAEEARAEQIAAGASEALAELSEVDWTVGEEAFVEEWGSRIDAYLAGSALEGYGETFAQAAWEYGVDPRWSPAISNTESSKGANCFKSHNAWGWMSNTTWSTWEEAIYAHVAGLAEGYGYTISLSAASKYCPPTYTDWFDKTLTQMKCI